LYQPEILHSIEQSAFSIWLRETDSIFGFYFVLMCHTIGMVFLVGPSAAIDLRILGVAQDLPLAPMKKFYNLMYLGFVINVISGTMLLVAYPTKAVTNPDFYFKLTLIGIGMWILQKMKVQVFGDGSMTDTARMAQGVGLAKASLLVWVAVITAGRLLAYTYTYLLFHSYAPGG